MKRSAVLERTGRARHAERLGRRPDTQRKSDVVLLLALLIHCLRIWILEGLGERQADFH